MVQEAKSPVKDLVHIYIYIYDIKFLALLGAPYIYNISRLRVNKTEMYNMHFLVPKESFGQHINAMHLVNNCQLTSILQPSDHDHRAD
jgi:hypothetical protein